jgi:UPF0716 protein FxsA
MRVFLPLLLWPLVEIALFVTLGGMLGLWATLAIVIGTALLGVSLLRRMGLRSAERLRVEMGRMRDPLAVAGDSAVMALAGVLLILPGFLTDMLGALLLIAPLRRWLVRKIAAHFSAVSMRSDQPARRSDGIVIDGEFVELDAPDPRHPPTPSGWTRH